MILPRTINLSPRTTTTTTKPGQRIIRCLSHAVSVNNVFHMYSCWCENARVTAVLKRVHIQRGPLTRGRGVRHELICRSLWWGRRLLFFRFRRRKRARRTCGCHQKDFFYFLKTTTQGRLKHNTERVSRGRLKIGQRRRQHTHTLKTTHTNRAGAAIVTPYDCTWGDRRGFFIKVSKQERNNLRHRYTPWKIWSANIYTKTST